MFPTLGRLVSLAIAMTTTVACAQVSDATDPGTMTPPPANNGGESGTPNPSSACPSLGTLKPPVVPAQLEPPAGSTLMLRYRATGTQIYTCKATPGAATAFAWTFKAPQANLFDEACAPAGTHFAGPTWKSSADDSAVVGMKAAEAPAPTAGAIAWLLLKASSTAGKGVMNAVVAVQRVDTAGGVPPADGCSAAVAGSETSIPYSAVYYFYKGPASPASEPARAPGY